MVIGLHVGSERMPRRQRRKHIGSKNYPVDSVESTSGVKIASSTTSKARWE